MNRIIIYCATLLSLVALSCSKAESGIEDPVGGEGTISLALKSVSDSDAASDETTSQEYGSDASEYAVEIYRGEELYTSWSSFEKMVNPFNIASGDYSMRIYWGPNQPFAFGIPYYEGLADFNVARNQHSDISITAALANTKLKVDFSDRMGELYDDYWVEAATRHMTVDGVTTTAKYTKDVINTGYFKSAPITAYLMLILKGEQDVRYYKLDDINAKPQESYLLDIVPSISDASIDIRIDESTNDRIESFTVPIRALDYDIFITTPSENSSIITARGPFPLVSAVLKMDANLAEQLSLDASYEFIGISQERILELNNIGVEPVYNSDNKRVSVWLTEFFRELPAGSYTFEFVVTDTEQKVVTTQFTVEI